MECKNNILNIDKLNQFYDNFVKDAEKNLKNFEKKKENTKEYKEYLKSMKKNYNQIKTKKSKNKFIKDVKESYFDNFCNPGCKNTILEPGDPDSLPKGYIKKNKINKSLIDIYENRRKELFGKETNVLNDDFYNKLSKKTIKNLKNKGAISGCIQSDINSFPY